MRADITAIIPTYNRAFSTCRAIESILAQTLPVTEIIVVDDSSTDDTIQTIQSNFGERVRIVRHTQNCGASAARNTGYLSANTEYVAFLDSDDIWLPNKIESQMNFIRTYNLDASCTNVLITYDDGKTKKSIKRPYPDILTLSEITYGCYLSPGSTMIVKRKMLEQAGGYDVDYKRYEDWDLLLKLLYCGGRLGYMQQDLAQIYADHDFSYEDALSSLKRIKERHEDKIRVIDKTMLKTFHSGLYFNEAATLIHAKDFGRGIMGLMKSLWIKPTDNWIWRNIFMPAILQKIGIGLTGADKASLATKNLA